MYAWTRDNYAINHFILFSFLVFQIFSFQSTWVVLRKTTRFLRRISYKRSRDDSWFSIDLPQCVLTDNTTGTLMYVVNFKDINLSFSLSFLRAFLLLIFRGPISWLMAPINVRCLFYCCCILCPYHLVYLHLKLWWWLCSQNVDESELNHLMRHSITRRWKHKISLKFKFVHHQLLAFGMM